jgi:hypothetical protein
MSDHEDYDLNDSESEESLSEESSSSDEDDELDVHEEIITTKNEEPKNIRNLPQHLRILIESKIRSPNENMVKTIIIQRCGDIANGAQPTAELDYKLSDLAEEKSYIIKTVIKEIREGKCPIGVYSEFLDEYIFLHNTENKEVLEMYLKDIEFLISRDNEFAYS